ncbi:MAG: hypothetical protein LQ346_008680 [Caloplaca aetnensis]|nr:MAG: hypothetical protein LQ346_008680 [Caloplaca aetnensis]
MRLLHAKTREFEEFFDTQIPPFAILSHRWGEKEVSFQQMRKNRAEEGPGLNKILGFCALASQKGYEWVWIDTCCIDKKSSAELSEAINSMFQWYAKATECFVYLSDVSLNDQQASDEDFIARFSASAWYSRGWTVQELLAPAQLTFYDADWVEIGDRGNLASKISAVTGIREQYLGIMGRKTIWKASVATRMSWVSKRQTSRSEDIAYCMLGLFDVNMPLLYGEGGMKAFLRLQTEIISRWEDETIFAWTNNRALGPELDNCSGLLASEPRFFADSEDYYPAPFRNQSALRYWMTNRGLAFQVPSLVDSAETAGSSVLLNLCVKRKYDNQLMGIKARGCSGTNRWIRCQNHSLFEATPRQWKEAESKFREQPEILYFRRSELYPKNNYLETAHAIRRGGSVTRQRNETPLISRKFGIPRTKSEVEQRD